ncbi:unnamed protein product [Rhizophagus irregularis]|nr:unnamed protein product [Rhizophagus irregularis]
MEQKFEHLIEGCNTMEAIRKAAIKEPRLKKELKQSLQPTIGLVNTIFQRQSLKDKTFDTATKQKIDNLWELILQLDPDLNKDTTRQFKHIKNMSKFNEFYDHCCQKRHYFFEIKKCGNEFCEICQPLSGDKQMFEKLANFSDSMPGNENHYMPFKEIYEKETDEKHRPSLKSKSNNNTTDSNDLQLKLTQQYVRNVGQCVLCIECIESHMTS